MRNQFVTSTVWCSLILGAGLAWCSPGQTQPRWPEGWKIQVSTENLHAKQNLYRFVTRVVDENGRPVNNATVRLRFHSFQEPGYRFVPAQAGGDGRYYAVTRIHPMRDNLRKVQVMVSPASN